VADADPAPVRLPRDGGGTGVAASNRTAVGAVTALDGVDRAPSEGPERRLVVAEGKEGLRA
jgi:hypothetical protein